MRLFKCGFLLLSFLLCWSSLYAGEETMPRKLPPPPGGLVEIHNQNQHFYYLLNHIEEYQDYFNYLKIRYFILPTIREGVIEKIEPTPEKALDDLRVYAVALKVMNLELFDRLDEEEKYSPTPEEWKTLRIWFRYMGALAYGERVVLKDGGSTYRELFRYSYWIQEEPDFFRQLVADYCQIAPRPFRSIGNSKISYIDETVPLFLPVFMVINQTFDPEPDLSRLLSPITQNMWIDETWKMIPSEAQKQFPVLYRTVLMIIGKSKTYNHLPTLFTDIKNAENILNACIHHPQFEELDIEKKEPILSLLRNVDDKKAAAETD